MTKSSHLLHNVKSTVKILSISVAFLENMNFKKSAKNNKFSTNLTVLVVCSYCETWLAHILPQHFCKLKKKSLEFRLKKRLLFDDTTIKFPEKIRREVGCSTSNICSASYSSSKSGAFLEVVCAILWNPPSLLCCVSWATMRVEAA